MPPRNEVNDREVRRDRWLKIAVAASLTSAAVCVAMLAVTISLLRRGPEPAASVAARTGPGSTGLRQADEARQVGSAEVSRVPSPWLGAAMRTGSREEPGPRRESDAPREVRLSMLGAQGPISPQVAELAERLNLRPAALERVAGADGKVPPAVVTRLERAADAGKGLGGRLGLDAGQSQTLGNLFLDQSLAVIDAEERANGTPEAEEIDAIDQDVLAGIRAVGGERAVEEARRLLEEMH